MSSPQLELADYRRQVSVLYAAVRAETDPESSHALWRAGRDRLFRTHSQSPLPAGDPLRETGLPFWPYDAGLRFELELRPAVATEPSALPAGDGTAMLSPVGRVDLPAPLNASIDVWWLDEYSGGLFVPLRDGTAADTSYGGGRYLLDSAKSADLGGTPESLIIDLNFLYHPSCRYDSAWVCPLAPLTNRITAPVKAGERLS